MNPNQTLQDKFPHLEVSVLKLSEVQKDNESKRIDSEYFKKEYLENEEVILKHEWDYLGNLASSIINFGAYSLCNYIEYVDKEDGVPFLNVGDIRENNINYENAKYIPLNTSKNILHKSLAKENQVLLTIAGSIGFAAVSYGLPPFTNSNQAIANIEIFSINPFYLSTYLNCRFGKSQMNKLTMSSVQPNLLLTQVKQIKIPLLPMEFQLEIEKLVKDSHFSLEQSKELYKEAEAILYAELGLNPKNPLQSLLQDKQNSINISIRTLKESFLKTGRLDSEYYQTKYDKIESCIQKYPTIKLKDLVNYPISSGATPKAGGSDYTDSQNGIAFLRAVDLKNARVETTNFLYINPEIHHTSLKRTKLHSGDVLFSIAGVIGRCAIFDYAFEANINQALAILRFSESEGINKLYLVAFFNSKFGQMYLEKYARQGLQTNLNLEEVGNLEIPLINHTTQTQIAAHIQKSFALRKEAKNLLQVAKVKVEEAIKWGGQYVLISEIFRIYYSKTKAKLRESKREYRLGEWLLYKELVFCNTESQSANEIAQKHFIANAQPINYTIKTLKESFLKTSRLDSEYYQTKYEQNEHLIKHYRNGYCALKDLITSQSTGFAFSSDDYLESGDLALIRINNIKNANLDMSNAVCIPNEKQDLSPKDKVKAGDILISMSGSVGMACLVRDDINAMVNQRILKISINNFSQDVLVLILNSLIAKLQFERMGTGGVQTNLSNKDIFEIFIPLLSKEIQQTIESKIIQSFALRTEAKILLEKAKAKVEEAIRKS